jgi:hypothetical protein
VSGEEEAGLTAIEKAREKLAERIRANKALEEELRADLDRQLQAAAKQVNMFICY